MIIMAYSFNPKENFAKALGSNVKISTKNAIKICRVIRNKPLTRVKRLLVGLSTEKRSLGTKHYTTAATEILGLVNSCEKNADFMGLDIDRLFVNASARQGTNIKRRRRKSGYGTKMKMTHVEIMLVERGKKSIKKEKKAEVITVSNKTELENAVKKAAEKVKEAEVKKIKEEPKKEIEDKKEVKTEKIEKPKEENKE